MNYEFKWGNYECKWGLWHYVSQELGSVGLSPTSSEIFSLGLVGLFMDDYLVVGVGAAFELVSCACLSPHEQLRVILAGLVLILGSS